MKQIICVLVRVGVWRSMCVGGRMGVCTRMSKIGAWMPKHFKSTFEKIPELVCVKQSR